MFRSVDDVQYILKTNVVHTLQGIPLYSSREEATKRYTCFKQTVDQVNEVNGQDKSYTLG